MDPITHITQKIMAERACQTTQRQPSTLPDTALPPPYTPSDSDGDSTDRDDDDDDDAPPSSPVKFTINAANSIQGSNNLVPTSPTPLADAMKFSTVLLHALKQINDVVTSSDAKPRRKVKVALTINCGITIIGDRNVIGNVGLKPKSPPDAIADSGAVMGASTVAGAKRKVEEVSHISITPGYHHR